MVELAPSRWQWIQHHHKSVVGLIVDRAGNSWGSRHGRTPDPPASQSDRTHFRSSPRRGDAGGFQSRTAITPDGRAVTIAVTNDEAGQAEVLAFFDKALCAKQKQSCSVSPAARCGGRPTTPGGRQPY
ncbi:hypothetical protein [Lentzea flaviverrucosa]|uniref:hypothetical protein n=1 Tax=Lentzea flaviverrucosa TaxID=200379 RepID=UPI0011602A41|nr:hypothetical protein [Lentzea flaviverrucosa]